MDYSTEIEYKTVADNERIRVATGVHD